MARTPKVRAFRGMGPMVKVGIAAAVGAAAGTYLEPELVKVLPESLKSETAAKVVHFGTIFVSAMGAYWLVSKL